MEPAFIVSDQKKASTDSSIDEFATTLLRVCSAGCPVPALYGVSDSSICQKFSFTDMPPAVKRACDGCHRRKVKCSGDGDSTRPCRNCISANIACTYDAIPQKKGPKGCRAKVISELRQNQAPVPGLDPAGLQIHPLMARERRTMPAELIAYCIDFFFDNLYPTQPILSRAKLQETIKSIHRSAESFSLIATLCAYMLIQPNMSVPEHLLLAQDGSYMSNTSLGMKLLNEAIEVRKVWSYIERPSADSIVTSFFLFGCYFCLEKHSVAWYHLRDATTLALLLHLDDESTYSQLSDEDAVLQRRIFYLLFVTERAYALQVSRPLTLHATVTPPESLPGSADEVELIGFNRLIRLYKPFDDTFVGLWNRSIDGCSIDWIVALQQQLDEALPLYLNDGNTTQAVDLRISQQWLKVMVWQLSVSQRFLSSTATQNAMKVEYPFQLSRELLADVTTYRQEDMEVHGIGLIKKLFDIGCTLVDIMSVIPTNNGAFEIGPHHYLQQFLHIISQLRGGEDRYLPMLIARASDFLPSSSIPNRLTQPEYTHSSYDEYASSVGAVNSSVSSAYASPIDEHSQHHVKSEYASPTTMGPYSTPPHIPLSVGSALSMPEYSYSHHYAG